MSGHLSEKLGVLLRYLDRCSTSNSGFVIIRGLPEVQISDYRSNKLLLLSGQVGV